MNSEFDSNQESGFLVDSDQRQVDDANRMIGMMANDDEIVKDFQRSDSGKATETVCGCSGSCDCASCNCLSDRAVENANESELGRSSRSFSGRVLDDNFGSLVKDALQDNRTDGEGIDFDALRERLGDEKSDFIENLISQFQRTDDGDSFLGLDALDFKLDDQKTSDS